MRSRNGSAGLARRALVFGSFAVLAAVLIGMQCLGQRDPAELFPGQQTVASADVRGTPLRAPKPADLPETPKAPELVVEKNPAPTPAPTSTEAPVDPPSPSPAATEDIPEAPPSRGPATIDVPPAPREPEPAPPPSTPSPEGPKPPLKELEDKPAAPAPKPAEPDGPKSWKTIDWDDISKYDYVPPEPDEEPSPGAVVEKKPKVDQIPEDIDAMSGSRIKIRGFAVPLDYQKGVVTKFILLPAPLACCFAEAPPMNRWMTVSNAANLQFDYGKYNVIDVSGVFDVGEEEREGYVIGIYRLKAEKIENSEE